MSYDGTDNSHLISLELNDELKREGIITKFGIDKRFNSLVLSLNHKYKEKNIVFSIPHYDKVDWTIFTEKFIKRLKATGIQEHHISMLEDVLQTNYETILGLTDNPNLGSIDNNGKQKEALFIRKYTANGLLPLHEAIVFADTGQSAFVYLDNGGKPIIVNHIERPDKILYPVDNLDSQNPLPYIFASLEELQMSLELASRETFDSLYQRIKLDLLKYVNVDEHYLVVTAADIIFSYFQDKFSTVHYNIFIGDNGSGKNSALLVISRLGYRVFYVVAASTPNYFTFYGDIEECQGTIAEDEASDLDNDYHKQKILKSGYTSGGTVPKIDFPNGKRSQAPYNVYGMKWLAMEELPDSRKTKGIFDRSFLYKFIAGHVDYNIKDIIKNAGDPKSKPLYDELVDLHKLLFAFRLVRYNDIVPDIQINIENRNAELTKPVLRLFSTRGDAAVAVEEIRLALSKFIAEKNELKANSIEALLYTVINDLIKESRQDPGSEQYEQKQFHDFTNDQIWTKFKEIISGIDVRSELLYSIEHGKISHKRITELYKSKFRAVSFKTSGNNSKRGLRFPKEVLERMALQYKSEDEIKILNSHDQNQRTEQSTEDFSHKDNTASDASDASLFKNPQGVFNENIESMSDSPSLGTNLLSESSTEQIVNSIDQDSNCTLSNKSNNDNVAATTNTLSTNTLVNRYNGQSSETTIKSPNNTLENNNNFVHIINKSSTENNNNNLLSKSDLSAINTITDTNQPKIYTNTPYTPSTSDASDASDAPVRTKLTQIGKTKAEQVGLPEIPCLFCDYKDPIEFDLSIHYVAKHRQDLIRLPIGKSSIDDRSDYAVGLSKKKLFESFDDEDEDDDENEGDE
jgi:hypothetical protein